MAKAWNVISNAKVGLADICATVLNSRLNKFDPAHLGSNWNSETLSDSQIQYAAHDVYASLQIYLWLATMSVPEVIPINTPPGTPVSLHHDDGKLIATGILDSPPSQPVRGIPVTSTQAKITVHKVLVPGAVILTHKSPLHSFGATPFEIVVKHNKLKTHCTNSNSPNTPHHNPSESIMPLTQSLSAQPLLNHNLETWFSHGHSPDGESWAEDVDESPNPFIEEDTNVAEAEVDDNNLQEGISTFAAVGSSLVTWSCFTWSLVLMDIWHAMACIRVSRTHGFQ